METVIFDMDGVIIDSEKIYRKIENHMFLELDIDMTEEEHRDMVGIVLKEAWRTLKDKYALEKTVEELVGWERKLYFEHIAEHGLPAVPGVRELIEDIRQNGVRLALASSSYREEINAALDATGLKEYFTVIVSGSDVKEGKPAPDIFLLAAKKTGSAPDRCIVIEDSGNGIQAAKAAGMVCVAYKNPDTGDQDHSNADVVISDFRKIDYDFLYKTWRQFRHKQRM